MSAKRINVSKVHRKEEKKKLISPSYEHRREAKTTVHAIQPQPVDSSALPQIVSYLQYSVGIANPEPQPKDSYIRTTCAGKRDEE